MFNKFFVLIFKGLLTVLPFVITIYLLTWLTNATEGLLSPFIPPEFYFPGLGIALALVLLAAIGIVVNIYVVSLVIDKAHGLFDKLPLVKTLFGAIKDAVDLFEVKNMRKVIWRRMFIREPVNSHI